MAEIAVLRTGRSGTLVSVEMLPQLRPADRLTLIGEGESHSFVPSNPWVAVDWRQKRDTAVGLAKVGFEKYFLRKIRAGESEPFYERSMLKQLNTAKLKEPEIDEAPRG